MNLKAAILCLVICHSVFSWGPLAHEAVAKVAANLIEKKTTDAMQKQLNGKDLVFYAPKPDDFDHCEGGEWSKTMHFFDVNGKSIDLKRDCLEFCNYKAILNYTKRLKPDNPKCVAPEHATPEDNPEPCALEFLTHFIADIHQPLHVTDNYIFPLGGSRMNVTVTFQKGVTPYITNIHKVWDTTMIEEYLKRNYGDYYSWEPWAVDIQKELLKDDSKKLKEYEKSTDPLEWAKEALNYSCNVAVLYDRKHNITNEDYFVAMMPYVNEMVEKATARLIKSLDTCLGFFFRI